MTPMRKVIPILFIAFLALINQDSFAQAKLKFAIVGEPQLSWLKPDIQNVESGGVKLGIKYGLNMERYFQENYAFATGVLINNTGGFLQYTDSIYFNLSNELDTISPNEEIEYKIQYIEIPIALKFTTNEIGYLKYFAQIGLNAQIRVKATADIASKNIQNANIKDEVSLFNAGYHIGGGVHYSLGGNSALTAAIIFTNGFIDVTPLVADQENIPPENARLEDKVIMNSLALKVGIIF